MFRQEQQKNGSDFIVLARSGHLPPCAGFKRMYVVSIMNSSPLYENGDARDWNERQVYGIITCVKEYFPARSCFH